MNHTTGITRLSRLAKNPVWVLVAAFGTYFCMYGFRKPYTAATYSDARYFGIDVNRCNLSNESE